MWQPLIRAFASLGLTLLFGFLKRQKIGRIREVATAWAGVATAIDEAGADQEVTLEEAAEIQKAVEAAIEATKKLLGR